MKRLADYDDGRDDDDEPPPAPKLLKRAGPELPPDQDEDESEDEDDSPVPVGQRESIAKWQCHRLMVRLLSGERARPRGSRRDATEHELRGPVGSFIRRMQQQSSERTAARRLAKGKQ
jgi:hypothetical protein